MDNVARALADSTRRDILELVRDDEQTVGGLAEHFPVSRPAISQHLRVLQDAELVEVRSEGTRHFYRTRPEGMADLARWMAEFWGDALADLALEAGRDQWNERKQRRKP